MIKRLKNIVKSTFVSPEFGLFCLLFLVYWFSKKPFEWVGYIIIYNDLLDKSTSVPFLLFCFILYRFKDIVIPPHRERKKLTEWNEYQNFKDTTAIGLGYILIGVIAAFVASYIYSGDEISTIGFILTVSYTLSIISSITIFFASIKVEEILEKYA